MNISNITAAATYCLHILHHRISSNSSICNKHIKQSFYTIIVHPDDGPVGLKHVGVRGFNNIIVNLLQLCEFVGSNYYSK